MKEYIHMQVLIHFAEPHRFFVSSKASGVHPRDTSFPTSTKTAEETEKMQTVS